jgi:hypothetical protein
MGKQLYDKPMTNIACRLSDEDIELFRELGGGSYSLGIRRAARMIRENRLSMSAAVPRRDLDWVEVNKS